jgi:hypothetical protein
MADPVATALVSGESATATTTVNFSAQTAGSLLYLAYVGDDYKTGNPSGWSLAYGSPGAGEFHGHAVWYKIANGSETSVQYTIGSASKSVYVLGVVTNIDNASPLDIANGQSVNSSSNSYTTPSVSTSAGRRIGIAFIGGSNSGTVSTGVDTWLNSYAELQDQQTAATVGLELGVATLVFDGGGSTSSGASYSGGWTPQCTSGMIAVFKNASATNSTDPAVRFSPMSEHPFDGLTPPWDLRPTQPPIPMAVWTSEPSTALPVAAELGSGTAAAAVTAVEQKVAVQGGSCSAGAAASASEKKVAVAASVAAGAGSVSAAEKKVAPQAGSSQGAAAGVATEVRVAPQAGSCTAAAAGTSVHTVGVPPPNADDPTQQAFYALFPPINDVFLQSGTDWQPAFVRQVWFGQDPTTIPTAAETGTAGAAAGATAVEKKVAVQGGSCTAAPAGTSAEKKATAQRGTVAAAAAGASVETSGAVAIEKGTGAAGAAVSASEKKVAVQGGSCSAGAAAGSTSKKVASGSGHSSAAAAATGVCKKIGKSSGAVAGAACLYGTERRKITQAGQTCAAAVLTALDSSPQAGMTPWMRVLTADRLSRVHTGAALFHVLTGSQLSQVDTGNG